MPRLITLGLLAAVFFSSSFLLNRVMSLEGGSWVWTASLRYGYMVLFLTLWLWIKSGSRSLQVTWRLFRQHPFFWILSGTLGCGIFYAPLCFSAAYAPAWVVASSWQATILATPIVLIWFGKRVPWRAVILSTLIFVGILFIQTEQALTVSLSQLLLGVVPVLVAAFAYPIGNQMVGEAKAGTHRLIPFIQQPIMNDPAVRVLLMSFGSFPFWAALILWMRPPPPLPGQWFNTALVALSSGVIATTLFLHARHTAKKPYEIAAVDATQAGEAVFSLLGEILFLSATLPGVRGWGGLILILVGITLYAREQVK